MVKLISISLVLGILNGCFFNFESTQHHILLENECNYDVNIMAYTSNIKKNDFGYREELLILKSKDRRLLIGHGERLKKEDPYYIKYNFFYNEEAQKYIEKNTQYRAIYVTCPENMTEEQKINLKKYE